MITKRHLVIAVLCTFCLTFALLTILPAGSNNSALGTGEYDPWIDSNEDGHINAKEAVQLGMAFDTFGDPTKNVNVTNWPPHVSYYTSGKVDLSSGQGVSQYLATEGYAQIVVSGTASGTGAVVTVIEYIGDVAVTSDTWPIVSWFFPAIRCYPVRTSHIFVMVKNNNNARVNYTVQVQLEVTLTTSPCTESPPYKSGKVNWAWPMNFSWATGEDISYSNTGTPFFTEGYDRIYLSLMIVGASQNISGANVVVYPCGMSFTDFVGYGNDLQLDSSTLNITINRFDFDDFGAVGWSVEHPGMVEPIAVSGPYFYMDFKAIGLQSIAPSGWITIDCYYYLRNE